MIYRFVIPGRPCSINGKTRITGGKGKVRTYSSRKWQDFAGRLWLATRPWVSAHRGQVIAKPFLFRLEAYWDQESKKTGLAHADVDNPIKPTLDALKEAGVIEDDAWALEASAKKLVDKGNPRTVVEIEIP